MVAPRKSLQRRLLLLLAVGAAIFAGLTASVAYFLAFDRAIENGRNTIEGLMASVEKTAAIGAYTGDRVLLQEIADGLSRHPLCAYVDVRGTDGRVLAFRQNLRAAPDLSRPSGSAERTLFSPFDATESVGALRITADTIKLRNSARQEAATLAVLMVAQAMAVAALVYMLAARLVSRPIVRMADALRGMQPGTSERLETPRLHEGDEIGVLVHGANDLLSANEVALQRERDMRSEIERMEARYRQIFDSSSAGIFVLSAGGHLINCNPTVLRLTGWTTADIERIKGSDLGRELFVLPEMLARLIAEARSSRTMQAADLEIRTRHDDVRWVHCLVSAYAAPDAGQGASTAARSGLVECVMYDVTDRKRAESAVRHLAEHDGLTGLKNRHASELAMERAFAEAEREHTQVSVLYIDLDGFKQVNDTFGHEAGDTVLVECARRMRAVIRRSTDLVGRFGGDEFVIAMHNVGPADESLNEAAHALIAALAQPIELADGQSTKVGVSIGAASFPRHGQVVRDVLQAADGAMYEVKRTGKNRFAVASGVVVDEPTP